MFSVEFFTTFYFQLNSLGYYQTETYLVRFVWNHALLENDVLFCFIVCVVGVIEQLLTLKFVYTHSFLELKGDLNHF